MLLAAGLSVLTRAPYAAIICLGLGAVVHSVVRPSRAGRERAEGGARDHALQQTGLVQGANGISCPKCGGTQFKRRRTPGGRVAVGAGAVAFGPAGAAVGAAATQQRVQCVTCGLYFRSADASGA